MVTALSVARNFGGEQKKLLEKNKKVNTKVLVKSKTSFGWCINPYNGCMHGCQYCYGMVTKRRKYLDWIKAKPINYVVQRLHRDIINLKKNEEDIRIQDIFVGSITDSYQPMEAEYEITRHILEVLIKHELPFTALTKSDLVLRDIDIFKGYEWCRIGVTITSFDEDFRKELEPFTASYDKRIAVLQTLKENGISTYLSCEPIFPVKESDPIEITSKLKGMVDLFEFGMWTKYWYRHIPKYYWENYSDEYYINIFKNTLEYCKDNKINYCIAAHSQKFFRKHGLPVKPYPPIKPHPIPRRGLRQTQMNLLDFTETTC